MNSRLAALLDDVGVNWVVTPPKEGQVWEFRPDEEDLAIWSQGYDLSTFPRRLLVESFREGWGTWKLIVRRESTNELYNIKYGVFRALYKLYVPTSWERLAAVADEVPGGVER